ncbi:MAG: hypothetical protein M1838_000420 [Thelocarpon superellum]|nr:MAG: hypothetical protein M1838_000420 [Thelocarpon superellum]
MGTHLPTPPTEAAPGEGHCRLKKAKCDGDSPCGRCKTDNAICYFGERRRSLDRVYPRGYVEMLEQQQAQLVAGVQELYRRTQDGTGWTGPPLPASDSGHPLTHALLERLGALKAGHHGDHGTFEEDLHSAQTKLFESGAGIMLAHPPCGSDSETSPTSPTIDSSAPYTFPVDASADMAGASPTSSSPASVRLTAPPQLADCLELSQLHPSSWSTAITSVTDNGTGAGPRPGTTLCPTEEDVTMSLNDDDGPCLLPDWKEDEDFQAFLGQVVE